MTIVFFFSLSLIYRSYFTRPQPRRDLCTVLNRVSHLTLTLLVLSMTNNPATSLSKYELAEKSEPAQRPLLRIEKSLGKGSRVLSVLI